MAATRKTSTFYTPYEKHVLLTGVPVSPMRFGYPRRIGWNIEEIRRAWELLSEELLELWAVDPQYAYDRERHTDPFVVRLLDGRERQVL
jgi:hypothetical protein